MPYLIAAVVFVGLLCAADLLLTMAVVRRLREHTRQLGGLAGGAGSELLAVGAPVPPFTGESVDGEEVDSATMPPTFVGFLSTTCRSCADQLPELVSLLHARGARGEERGAAAVVVAGPDSADSEHFVDQLRPIATVIREPRHGPVCHAFSNEIFPSFYLIEDGVVTANAISVEGLADPVAA